MADKKINDLDLYHPGSKGDARWDRGYLETADGWIVACGSVKPHLYSSVKGIDLVNRFTHLHLEDRKAKEAKAVEAQKKIAALDNPLNIPNPFQSPHSAQTSRHRRRNHRHSKRRSAFLALPAEIRNKIYSYAIPDSRLLIQGTHPGRELAFLKTRWNPQNLPVLRPRYRLYHLLDNEDMDDNLEISAALLFVCKKVNTEVELFMYSRLTFCFESMKVIHKFLNVASRNGLKSIRKLELHQAGYGIPEHSRYQHLKEAHDDRWRRTCERIANELPALEMLRLEVALHDEPITFRSSDQWRRDLMSLIPHGPLDNVEVVLSHYRFSEDKMAQVSRRVEDRMMSEKGKHLRDEQEAVRAIQRFEEAEAARRERLKELPPVQAKSVLRIVIEDEPSGQAKPEDKKVQKKYYTSDTARYATKQTVVYCPVNPS